MKWILIITWFYGQRSNVSTSKNDIPPILPPTVIVIISTTDWLADFKASYCISFRAWCISGDVASTNWKKLILIGLLWWGKSVNWKLSTYPEAQVFFPVSDFHTLSLMISHANPLSYNQVANSYSTVRSPWANVILFTTHIEELLILEMKLCFTATLGQ